MLILVRHGQAAANAEGRLLGRADQPLTDLGRAQAAACGRWLRAASDGEARVVTSPLRRARESAALLGLPVTVDERWIEMDYGDLEGATFDEVPAETWRSWRSDRHFRPPGGESLAEVGERVRAACEGLVTEATERDVVVVSHVSPIKAAVAWSLGVGEEITWRMHLAVAALSRVGFGPRGPVLWSFGEVSHLDGVGSPA